MNNKTSVSSNKLRLNSGFFNLGASVFWIHKLAAIDDEQKAVEYWQIKRDNTKRGIVEVIHNDSEQSRTLDDISTDQIFSKTDRENPNGRT